MFDEQDNFKEKKMKDKYFERMGIPEDAACYVKCIYQSSGSDYFVGLNDRYKGFTFVDGDLIKDVKKDVRGETRGLIKAMLVNEIREGYHIWINGEGFGVPKNDVIFVNKQNRMKIGNIKRLILK